MPEIDMVVALWNRDTAKKQTGFNPDRLRLLNEALQACQAQFATILKPSQRIKGIFVAPEYYFARENAGQVQRYGSLNDRCLTETGKEFIVQHLLTVSKTYPQVLLIPGTVAWKKSLNRTPEQEFKRNPETYQRTTIAKTQTRQDSVFNAIRTNFNNGGARGGYLATELLRSKIRRELNPKTGLASPGDVGMQIHTLFDQSENDLKLELQARFGTSDGMYKRVPTHQENVDALFDGTATHVMKNTAFVFLNGKIRFKYNKKNDFHEALSDAGQTIFCPGYKSGFATVEGIDIGLEICLDHAARALANTPLPPSGTPVFHIITSASVGVTHAVVRENGYLIHASSDTDEAMVSQRTSTGWNNATPVQRTSVGGDPLDLYKIKVTVP